MSEDWGRHYEFLALDEGGLSRLLQPAFPGAEVVHADALTSGHCNTNYKVSLRGRENPFVVRIHTKGVETARKEFEVLRLVRGRVPAPDVVWTGFTEETGASPVTLLRWIEGIPLTEALKGAGPDEVVQLAAAAGKTLAAIGTFTFPRAGFFVPGLIISEPHGPHGMGIRSFVEERLFKGRAGQRLGDALSRQLWSFVLANVHKLDRLKDKACLVHSDYHGSNIIVRRAPEGWAVAAVLDWEFAWSGPPICDVGIMLRRTARRWPAFEAPFVQSFAEHGGEYPPDGRNLARVFDLVNLLDFMENEHSPEALQRDITAALRETVESVAR